ncbi:hypothetical protein PIROE2DRAFT_5869 [Piromyces sp. E2]|nr:hypothetical protein PIROE2DRAFT_5869 [Piromyces sp. E2]|eukprot:OUM66881.1 hypothetical protein PIROE2DRAFT_5869 [Piromyces sp. E2]
MSIRYADTSCYYGWFQVTSKISCGYKYFIVPALDQCFDDYLFDDDEYIVCSSPPYRLRIKRGKNTSLTAFKKFGEPGKDYFECARIISRKQKSSTKDRSVKFYSGVANQNDTQTLDSQFNGNQLKIGKFMSVLYGICAVDFGSKDYEYECVDNFHRLIKEQLNKFVKISMSKMLHRIYNKYIT